MKKFFTLTAFLLLLITLFAGNTQAQSPNALNFDGSNDYVAINSPFSAFNKEITVEFWMSTPSANMPFGCVMGQGTSNVDDWISNNVWIMHPNTDGTMTFYVNDGGTARAATCNLIAGSWHHYAGVANATSTKIYVDGALVFTGAGVSNTIMNNNSSVIHIGKDVRYNVGKAYDKPRYANMSIDEVRIWNRALCQDEIVQTMNCEANSQTGLQELYHFNQSAGTTLTDASGNGRDGTLTNFALTGASSNWVTSGSTNTGTCAPYVAPTSPITGTTSICIGTSTTLANAYTGGTWSSSNTAVATINATTGVVTSVGAGTSTITYKTADCGGVSTATLTVNALPLISAGSNSPVCRGGTLNLSSNGGVSYTWTGPNGFNANTQNPSVNNIVAAAAGTYSVQGTDANGCKNNATVVVTVNTLDSDGDGIPDACDEDADNDGIPNALECNKSNFFWSNPPTVSANTATGTINGIAYTYTSSSPVTTTSDLYGHGNFPTSYGVPNANPTIQNIYITNNTITFASPMTNPVLVFASIGQAGLSVPISFGAPVQVVWSLNVVQNSTTQITGTEGYAIVRMMGTFSSISFKYEKAENYCNFAFGADFQSCGDTDGDGIPDYLDLDSDNDGCPDAIEGSMGFSMSQTSGNRLIGGVDSHGIPLLAGTGQGIGTSQNYVINCFCQPGFDKTSPTVITKNIPVYLDANGNATITAAQVNNGSTDNCSIASYSLDKTNFTCSNLGANTVTLRVTDGQGNVGTATATVTVTDTQVPNVVTQNVTVYLDNNGQANVTAAQVNNGSADNCGIATMTVSPASFTCVDKTAPVTTNIQTIISDNTWAESTTTYSTGNYCLSGTWNGVSSPMPSLGSYSIVPTIYAYSVTPISGTQGIYGLNGVRFFRKTFNLTSLSGIKATLLAAMDNGVQIFINGVAVAFQGNMSSDGATFNGLSPDRVILNSTGANVNGGVGYHSFDNITNANASNLFVVGTNEIVLALANCDGDDRGAISFKAIIENKVGGPGSVVLTVTDASGNSASANAQVTVVDAIKPVINCPNNIVVYATSAAGAVVTYNAPVATDNCSVASLLMTGGKVSGSIFQIGTTPVSYRATDASGNFADCSFTVTVKGLPPVIVSPGNIAVSNTPGACGANVNFAATETTGIPASTIAYSINPGSFFPVGTTIVNATATNAVGSSSCSFNVTVTDNENPTIAAPAAISVSNDAGKCSAVVALGTPTVGDNCGVSGTTNNAPTTFPVGTTTVTWTVTDIHGNSSTATQIVTVTDNENPTITAPASVAVNNDAGKCSAVVVLGTPTVGDNCGVAGTTNNAPAIFPVGSTTVTWTVTDIHGNSSTATQTVTVTDNEKPTITAPASVAVNNDAGKCGAVVALGTPVTGDNCGVAGTTNNAPAIFPVGSTTVTWTVTDIHGNSSTATQTVTVTDNEKPTITAPASVAVNNDAGNCSAVVALGTPTVGDNCGVAGTTNNAPAIFPVGSTTVTWTVTDIHGNSNTTTQTVTVTDNEKPVLVCAANQVFCANFGGVTTYSIPALTASDNCAIATTTYAVTGASTRNGSGNDAGGVFAIGVSTVTFTVTDIHNNVSTCSFTVTINPLPVAAIAASTADAFCNKLTLTGSSTLSGPFSYQWLYANGNFSTNNPVSLDLLNGDGVYSLYTTDGNGCRSEFAATYTYQKQNLSSSYTILAYKEAELGGYNTVASGSVGVMSSKGEAEFGGYSKVTAAGSFVKAVKIKVDENASVAQPIFAAATPQLPTMLYNSANTRSLPDYKVKKGTTVILNGNYGNLNIQKGSVVTLTGNTFGTIHTEEGVQLTFTQSTISIDQLNIDKGPKTAGYSYVHFAPDTKVLVSRSVSIGNKVYLNPENNKVTFYVGKLQQHKKDDDDYKYDDGHDDTRFSVHAKDSKVTVNVMMPSGKLKVNGNGGDEEDDDHDGKKPVATSINMTGLFVAAEVASEGKYVIWNSFDCNAAPVALITTTTSVTPTSLIAAKAEGTASDAELKVTVMPNPSTTYFTLKLESRYETPVNMRVMDGSGRVVDTKSGIGSNSTIQIGHNYSSGTYYAEMIQGTRRKIVQLIKGRE